MAEPCTFMLAGVALETRSLVVTERLSTLFHVALRCHWPDAEPNLDDLLGKAGAVLLRDSAGYGRRIEGIVAEAAFSTTEDAFGELAITLRPAAYPLTLGRGLRVFHDASVADIVADVLGRTGVAHHFELTREYDKRPYTAQYRESDWQLISRLLEEEGIYYWFDHEERQSRIVFADNSTVAQPLLGEKVIRFVPPGDALSAGGEHIRRFGHRVAVTSTKYVLAGFDPARPALKVQGTAGQDGREVYSARGAGPADPATATRRAIIRMEADRSAATRASGSAISVRLTPGRGFQQRDHLASSLDGEYLIVSANLRIAQRRRGHGADVPDPIVCNFECVRAAQPYRPPAVTPLAQQTGMQTAVVVGPGGQEIYPDEAGRVRLQMRWDREGQRDEKAGRWTRVMQRGTADSMLLPRMGWNVLTMSEEGTVDLPVTVARIFDAAHPPPYPLPANKTRVAIRTATTPGGGSYNELRFEDRAGDEEFFINASKDMTSLVQNAKTEKIMANSARTVGVDNSLDVGVNATENVVGGQGVAIGGDEMNATGTGRQKNVGGDESISIGGVRKVSTGEALSTDVTGLRTLLVGGAQLDISIGDIKLACPVINVVVGGIMLKLALRNINEDVDGKGVLQTIGAAKLEVTPQMHSTNVGGPLMENVGGVMTILSQYYHDKATATYALTAGGSLTAQAPEIVFDADSKITISSGGATIVVTAAAIEISAAAVDQSGGMVDKLASTVQVN